MERVDAAASLIRFARKLRRAGLGVSQGQLESYARAFEWLDPLSRADVYHAARATLVTRREDLALFDRVFDDFWLGAASPARPMPLAPRHDRPRNKPLLATLLAQKAESSDPAVDVTDRSHTASDDEVLRRKDFASMSDIEEDAVRRLLGQRRWDFATRISRRRRRRSGGPELDLGRVPARAARSGGMVLTLPRRERIIKQRPLVILADVSGSMELYTRVLLTFFYALRKNLARVESFVFATRLTRISAELELGSVDRALSEVASRVVDIAGGTRIGDSLHTFNTRWAGQVLGRGAVVVVVSDGWERGSPETLKKEMRILKRRCHRLIWLNPRLGEPRYEPRVEGMAAALAHVDDFLTCHNLQSLERIATELGALSRRRGGVPAQAFGRAA
jgi:uncharacterized protein with von Willebrand factor type A (vWA) domain